MNTKNNLQKLTVLKNLMLLFVFATCLASCSTSTPTRQYPKIKDPVCIAVNLGIEHYQDLAKLEDSLTAVGIPCVPSAISLNEGPIVVERADFDRAKAVITNAIIEDALTVRIFTDANSSFDTPLEVWEHGKKTREEPRKLY